VPSRPAILKPIRISASVGPDLVSGRARPRAFLGNPSSANPANPTANLGATQGRALQTSHCARATGQPPPPLPETI
jgi:hypothetical protein